MAGTKIVDLTALGRNLASTDLFELSLAGGTGSRKITGQEIINATGITIGTTAITSGTVGRVLFEGTGNVVQESANLFWDNTNGRLGVGTSSPAKTLSVVGSATSGFDAITFKGQYSETGYLSTSNGAVYFASGAGVTGSFLELSSAIANLRGGTTAVTFTVASERMRINNAGNVLINTTTDAGFKLDVNGTARINTLTIGLGTGQVATNTVLGFQALNANTSGIQNVAIGYQSVFSNTTGSGNVAIGVSSLVFNSTGSGNTAFGDEALLRNTTGGKNIAIGQRAGTYAGSGTANNQTSSDSIYIGYQARASASGATNELVFGKDTVGSGSNSVTLGNTSIIDTIFRGRIKIQQYATGSRPTYVKGALIYDSTLSKLVVGGASDWEVVTST